MLFAFIFIFILILIIYIKIKNPFWSIQPVYHPWKFWYLWFPPGIIEKHNNDSLVPQRLKYINTHNISVIPISKFTEDKFSEITSFIRKYYCNEKEVFYNPCTQNILSYFYECNKSYIALYKINNELLGCITSRPIYVELNQKPINTYYVDNLCIHKQYRKKGLAPELIQTIANKNKKQDKLASCFLFKRERKFTKIMPIVKYTAYAYNFSKFLNSQKKSLDLYSGISLFKICDQNFNVFFYFLKIIKYKFNFFIFQNINILFYLLKTKNIFIYSLIQNNEIIAIYCFRDATTMYEGKRSIECFCTINNCKIPEIFTLGFYDALIEINSNKSNKSNKSNESNSNFPILLIEDTADSNEIIQNLNRFHKIDSKHEMGYYYYNFAYPTIHSNNTCLLF